MDGLCFERVCFCFLFRVCIKKIREKLVCLTLSSHSHSPARAQRDRQTDGQKDRRETKTEIAHRALFIRSARREHPHRARAFADSRLLLISSSFFLASARGKKNVFQVKKGCEKY
jgi:hypothetical protein